MNFSKVLSVVVVGALLTVVTSTSGFALSQSQRLADFQQLVSIIERNYAPLRWKETSIGLDWKQHIQSYRGLIAETQNDRSFYQLLAKFLAGLQDAHVSSQIPSTYEATLGFSSDFIDGKVLIETIDRARLPEELFPFKKGDQLLALGGVPVGRLMQDLDWAAATGNKASADRITAARLTQRREARGLSVPKGVTTITVLPVAAAKPVTVTATWITKGLPVFEQDDLSDLLERDSSLNVIQNASTDDFAGFVKNLGKLSLFNMKLPTSTLAEWSQMGVADIGAAKSMFEASLPANFQRLNDGALPIKTEMTSGIYEVGGKKIGLIRIPAYDNDSVDPADGLPVLLKFVAYNVMVMEQLTDVLVIDQTNNPGGAVDLVTQLTGMFAKESAVDMVFKIRPSLNWAERFSSINTQIERFVSADPKAETDIGKSALALQSRFRYLEDEMREALQEKRFLTAPVSLNLMGTYGVVQPQPVIHYSKPVLMLINEFDFSGGDAFPAILKDNNLVTLFGAQTSGAGGNVSEYGPLTNSHFKLHLTESLMVRPNGNLVENRGIVPDVAYKVTAADFNGNYRSYLEAFTREAVKLAGGDPNAEVPAPGSETPAAPVTPSDAAAPAEETPAAPADPEQGS